MPMKWAASLARAPAGWKATISSCSGYYQSEGPRRIHPFAIPMVICDSASGAMAIDWNLRGPNFAPVSACAAAADAIGLAYQAIKLGQAKAFVAGGSEATVHLVGILAFDRLGAMSHRNDDPAGACKPFDKNRDGIVMGEGAAALIVEDWNLRRRAARRSWPKLSVTERRRMRSM